MRQLFQMNKILSVMLAVMLAAVPVTFAQEESSGWTLGIDHLGSFDDSLTDLGESLPVEIGIDFSYVSVYMWRGQKIGDDASYQPSVTFTPKLDMIGSFSVNWWANMTQNQPNSFLESDITLDYTVNSKELSEDVFDFDFSTGYIYYYFPNSQTSTQEVYFGLAANTLLSPSITWYHDWNQGSGEWIEFGISHDIDLNVFTVATYATLNYNHRQWNFSSGTESGFATLDFGASIPIALGEHMTMEPFLSYTKRLETFRTAAATDLTEDELYGGVNFSIVI